MTSVLLVDDHKLFTDGLKTILEGQSNVQVTGVASDGLTATKLAFELKPDLILMDISMPKQNGIDAARNILRELPDTKIIMLSMHADRRFIQAALRVNARGYILKESAAEELIEAIKQVMSGELFFSHKVRDQVLKDYIDMIREDQEHPPSPLSGREREVLQVLAEGHSTKETAAILNVSVKTVESHRKQIMDKLNLRSIAELTKYAIREGLTQLD